MSKEQQSTQPGLSDLEIALADVSNQVYAASSAIERLEREGKVEGNGHHHRQALAQQAQRLVYLRWKNEAEKDALSPTHPAKAPTEYEA